MSSDEQIADGAPARCSAAGVTSARRPRRASTTSVPSIAQDAVDDAWSRGSDRRRRCIRRERKRRASDRCVEPRSPSSPRRLRNAQQIDVRRELDRVDRLAAAAIVHRGAAERDANGVAAARASVAATCSAKRGDARPAAGRPSLRGSRAPRRAAPAGRAARICHGSTSALRVGRRQRQPDRHLALGERREPPSSAASARRRRRGDANRAHGNGSVPARSSTRSAAPRAARRRWRRAARPTAARRPMPASARRDRRTADADEGRTCLDHGVRVRLAAMSPMRPNVAPSSDGAQTIAKPLSRK